MNSLERIDAVLNGRKADRIPVALHNYLQVARVTGIDDLEAWFFDGPAMAESHTHVWNEVGHDMIQLENSTCAMAHAIGCEVTYDRTLPPHVSRPVVESYSDLDALEPPDPFTAQPLAALVQAADILQQTVGHEVFIQARSDQGPIALAVSIMSPQQFLMDCLDPDKREGVHALLDFCTRCTLRLCDAYASLGVPGTCIGGMGTSLISPAIWNEFEEPYQRRYVDFCRRAGLASFIHTCGKEDDLVAGIVATGCDGLELDHLTDPELVARTLGNNAVALGLIDPVGVMANGTADDVMDAARTLFEIFEDTPSLIVGAGCALPPATPIGNCRALVEAARRMGESTS